MSFLIYLLIFFILPYFSTSSYIYGKIRNASIKLPFDIPEDLGYKLTVKHYNDCFCYAFRNSDKVQLFTCTKNASDNFTCQFYYFMPKRDEIDYPRYDTNIYLINKTARFEEKDDCCNTTYLIEQINKANRTTNFINGTFRFLIEGDNNTIVTTSDKKLYKFDRSTLKPVYILNITPSPSSTVGYDGKKYYLNDGQDIRVYDETLNLPIYNIKLSTGVITAIRFINKTQMLVGVDKGGYIFDRKNNEENFTSSTLIDRIYMGQVHAFGVVDENAFYVGWDVKSKGLVLYTKDQDNKWVNKAGNIHYEEQTSDIVIDNCKRIWAVQANGNKIFIYDQNKTDRYEIIVNNNLFNLVILENYTLVTSHGAIGLTRIRPSLNCLSPHYKRQ